MQIVIDIDEKLYTRIKYLKPKADTMLDNLMRGVQNGTPLPKGHGRLIDADALNFNADYNEPLIHKQDIDDAPTIIEADKEDK